MAYVGGVFVPPPEWCRYCGTKLIWEHVNKKPMKPNARTKDNVKPRSWGGGDRGNIVPACNSCNGLKAELERLVPVEARGERSQRLRDFVFGTRVRSGLAWTLFPKRAA